MTLKLYMHPLSSYCHKALIAFYENGTPFEIKRIDDPAVGAELRAMWPIGRFPVLRDESRDRMVPEATIIIEYLSQHYPGKSKLVPGDADLARQARMHDRFYDNYLHTPMQKIFADRRRASDKKDPQGVDEARALFFTALDMLEGVMANKSWSMGDDFTMADCAAAPPLFYGNKAWPFEKTHKNVFAYLQRLEERPSYARVLVEAKPFLHMLPS